MSDSSVAKLVCTAGPKAGVEFPLTSDAEVVVGRALGSTISIPDTSVSRRHCCLEKYEEGWTIADLGSGNGTLVNGDPITGPTLLRSADLVSVGDTVFRFEDPGNATRVQGALGPSRARLRLARLDSDSHAVRARAKVKKFGRLVGAGLVLPIVLGGAFAGRAYKNRDGFSRMKQEQQEQQRRASLGATFQDGKNLVREGRWAEARAEFEDVLRADPGYPGVQDYLDRANIEIPNAKLLSDAQEALERHQLDAAAEALGKVTQNTQQFERLSALRSLLETRREEQLAEANAAVSAPDAAQKPRPSTGVIHLYLDGDLASALSMADACAGTSAECRNLAQKIRKVAEQYKGVDETDAKGFERLLSLDAGISGGRRSKLARIVGARAAGLFFKDATSARAAGQWGKASDWARKALAADPGHDGATALLADARSHSRDTYMEGYSLKDTHPEDAVLKFREVESMTSPGDEFHERAQRWIEKLSR